MFSLCVNFFVSGSSLVPRRSGLDFVVLNHYSVHCCSNKIMLIEPHSKNTKGIKLYLSLLMGWGTINRAPFVALAKKTVPLNRTLNKNYGPLMCPKDEYSLTYPWYSLSTPFFFS